MLRLAAANGLRTDVLDDYLGELLGQPETCDTEPAPSALPDFAQADAFHGLIVERSGARYALPVTQLVSVEPLPLAKREERCAVEWLYAEVGLATGTCRVFDADLLRVARWESYDRSRVGPAPSLARLGQGQLGIAFDRVAGLVRTEATAVKWRQNFGRCNWIVGLLPHADCPLVDAETLANAVNARFSR